MRIGQIKIGTVTKYQLMYLLKAYKTGCFVVKKSLLSQYGQKAVDQLANLGYIEMEEITKKETKSLWSTPPTKVVLLLTQKGVDEVKNQFETCLRTGFLYHIFPILLPGDVVEVSKTLINEEQEYVGSPNKELPEGLYTINQVNQYTLLCTNQETEKLYRLKTYPAKEFLKLSLPTTLNVVEEMSKRFGTINVKIMTKKLAAEGLDNFKMVLLLRRIQRLSDLKNRLVSGVKNVKSN